MACEKLALPSIISYVNNLAIPWGPFLKKHKRRIKDIKKEIENTLKEVDYRVGHTDIPIDEIYRKEKYFREYIKEASEKAKNLNKQIAYAIFDYAKKQTGFEPSRKEKRIIADFYSEFGLMYTWFSVFPEGRKMPRKGKEVCSLEILHSSPIKNERRIAQYILSNPERSVKELLTGELNVYAALSGN